MLLLIAIVLALVFVPSPWGVVLVVGALAFEFFELAFWRGVARHYRIRKGVEAEIGAVVEVIERCDPDGRVRYRGEIWNARSAVPLERGQRARIKSFDGLTVELEPGEEPS